MCARARRASETSMARWMFGAGSPAGASYNLLTASTATNRLLTVGGSGTTVIRTVDAADAAASVKFERSGYSSGQAAVGDGDVLEQLVFAGFGGGGSTPAVTASTITVLVQQPSPSSSQMGGKIVLATTASGGTSPTNTWVLDNAGSATLGGAVTAAPAGSISFTGSCGCRP